MQGEFAGVQLQGHARWGRPVKPQPLILHRQQIPTSESVQGAKGTERWGEDVRGTSCVLGRLLAWGNFIILITLQEGY